VLPAQAGTATAAHRAGTYHVSLLRPVSGRSPFPRGCPGAVGDANHLPGSEIEPMVAVDPERPRTVVATWQQDLGAAGRADLVAVTHDAGVSWHRVVMSGTACTGQGADAASDPWVSVGPRGSMYFGGSTAYLSSDPPAVSIVAARSADRGRTWSRTRRVSGSSQRNDKPYIVADPKHALRAYMVWAKRDMPPALPSDSVTRFARTDDGGRSWSRPVLVDRAPPNAIDVVSEVYPLRSGALLALISRFAVAADGGFHAQLVTRRSIDGGRTWQRAMLAHSHPLPPAVIDPETGQELDSQDLSFFGAAVGRDGTVYVAWDSDTGLRSGGVTLISSGDGGRTWSAPRSVPGIPAFAMEPAVAAGPGGSVGVLWYDVRRDVRGDAALTTDVWFAHSADHGHTWRQTHVAGPFDMRTAPLHRLGEYQGLAAMGDRDFAAVFAQAQPRARHGASDIFFARLTPDE
jgi:photosystem II stability/assembly factor-like uncharacterized protein